MSPVDRQRIKVAPHVGAWIEMTLDGLTGVNPGRTPRGCVD